MNCSEMGERGKQLADELKLIPKWQGRFRSSTTESECYAQDVRKGQLVREILGLRTLCQMAIEETAMSPCPFAEFFGRCPRD